MVTLLVVLFTVIVFAFVVHFFSLREQLTDARDKAEHRLARLQDAEAEAARLRYVVREFEKDMDSIRRLLNGRLVYTDGKLKSVKEETG